MTVPQEKAPANAPIKLVQTGSKAKKVSRRQAMYLAQTRTSKILDVERFNSIDWSNVDWTTFNMNDYYIDDPNENNNSNVVIVDNSNDDDSWGDYDWDGIEFEVVSYE